jgi:hypothetical protein
MRTILLVIVLAAPALLGGCSGGNLQGNSMLPSASQAIQVHHDLDSVGGGPPSVNGRIQHDTDSVGGGPPKTGYGVAQPGDSVGGGPPSKQVKLKKMHHNSDSVGGGPPSVH